MKYRIRFFHDNGMVQDGSANTRDAARTAADIGIVCGAAYALIFEKCRGKWHVCFDSRNGG